MTITDRFVYLLSLLWLAWTLAALGGSGSGQLDSQAAWAVFLLPAGLLLFPLYFGWSAIVRAWRRR
ncbi:hypothetical protein J31TS4_17520 [Paenibacillus sp. J31TS4]|uniref:hypothetical protein n=1 Tax=Paenibacillus sp. J31TS4 TaxID=2807195 RepID=UPI001B2B45DA|nr:hypothetical protein [Paenibacillus sp. J31TS4]GIP38472.1 hypothetical protein J31TS4_17520 [Paenibacillus sp. J31TS4]